MRFIVGNRKFMLFILITLFMCTSCVYVKESSFNVELVNNRVQVINEVLSYDKKSRV